MGLGHMTCKGRQLFFVDRNCLTVFCESVCKYLHLLQIVGFLWLGVNQTSILN